MTVPASGTYGDVVVITTTGGSGTGAVSARVTGTAPACAVVATKAADGTYQSATSAPFSVTVSRAGTSVSVASSSGTYGGTTSASATLTSAGTPVSGKSVGFTLNGASIGSATTGTNGVATLASVNLAGINAGTYATAVGASFSGDPNYLTSSASGGLTVNRALGAVSINNLPTTSNVGNSLLLTYTTLGDGVPSTVSLSTSICTVAGGVVSFVAQGTCQLQASITPGTNYLAATNQVPQSTTVGPAAKKATTTTLTSSLNPSHAGVSVTFTATISASAATGTVTFTDNGTVLGTATVSNGQATITAKWGTPGNHTITARYGGDATYATSTSAALTEVVKTKL